MSKTNKPDQPKKVGRLVFSGELQNRMKDSVKKEITTGVAVQPKVWVPEKKKEVRDKKGRYVQGAAQKTNKNGNAGRKMFDGKDEKTVVLKLEQAFAVGASDAEACFYAEISEAALYSYQKKHPEFQEQKNRLKQKPVLQARQTLVKELATSVETAKWYLVKKVPSEFGDKQEFVHRVVNLSQEAEKRAQKYE